MHTARNQHSSLFGKRVIQRGRRAGGGACRTSTVDHMPSLGFGWNRSSLRVCRLCHVANRSCSWAVEKSSRERECYDLPRPRGGRGSCRGEARAPWGVSPALGPLALPMIDGPTSGPRALPLFEARRSGTPGEKGGEMLVDEEYLTHSIPVVYLVYLGLAVFCTFC